MSSQPRHDLIPCSDVEQLREAREIIRHEAQTLLDLSRRLDTAFCAAVHLLLECRGAVVVTGMGKAGLIGQKISATLSSLGTRSFCLHPAEAVHGDLGGLCDQDIVLALSNSGETEELCRLLPILRRIGTPVIALTSRDTSTLGSAATVTISLGQLPEAGQLGLAPTASTTAMLAVGDALALVTSHSKNFSRQQFAVFHPAGTLGQQAQSVQQVMRSGDQLRIARQTVTVREVLVQMRKPGRRTGAIMLVDGNGRLTGLFTDSDLVRLLETRRDHQVDRPIGEVMTSDPLTVLPEAPLSEAIELLSRHHISELPVVDPQQRPIGLIDITDIIGLLPAEGTE
jgi:arabinose-5-phosphate isomerase